MTKNIISVLGCVLAVVAMSDAFAQQKDYPIQPVPFTQVHVDDKFWEPKMEVNAKVTIPYVLQQCNFCAPPNYSTEIS
jgi:hypothetical protein